MTSSRKCIIAYVVHKDQVFNVSEQLGFVIHRFVPCRCC